MFHISGLLDRSARCFNFLSAYQLVIRHPDRAFIFRSSPSRNSGLVPEGLGKDLVLLVTILVLMCPIWLITRTTSDINGGAAAGVVLLNMILAVFITGTADGMLT